MDLIYFMFLRINGAGPFEKIKALGILRELMVLFLSRVLCRLHIVFYSVNWEKEDLYG